jgi:hypothetical protein
MDTVRMIYSPGDVLSDLHTEYPTAFRDSWNPRR